MSSWLPQCLHWPFCPGVFIALLAFVAAAVTFRKEPEAREKAVWIFVFLGLMSGEVWMMSKDRKAYEQTQVEQFKHFTAIVNQITGDDSFSYAELNRTATALLVANHGFYPLTSLHVRLVGTHIQTSDFDFAVLTPHLMRPLYQHNFQDANLHDMNIIFNAVNGSWMETFQTRVADGVLRSALRVIRFKENFQTPEKLESLEMQEIWCKVDDGYPLVNGLVQWNEPLYGQQGAVTLPAIPCTRH